MKTREKMYSGNKKQVSQTSRKPFCRLVKLAVVVFFYTLIMPVKAQDAHLSQFDASPMILNPSYTGMLEHDDLRATSQYRSQWARLGSSYTTTTLAFDAPVDKQVGAGIYLSDDDQSNMFGVFRIAFAGAYQISSPVQRKYRLCVGLHAGFIYKRTKESRLVYDNQYYDGSFDTDLPTGEAFEKLSVFMPEVNLGMSYTNIEDGKLFNPYVGLVVYHLTNPKESFYKSKNSRLPMRFVLHGGSKIYPREDLILDPNILVMKQLNNYEILGGISARYLIMENMGLMAGASYRWRDAVIPMIGFNYNNYLFRISYDITVSELRYYNKGFGGLEFSLVFRGSTKGMSMPKF